jgi:hypothetical protein
MTKENKILAGAGVVCALGLAYLYWKKKKNEQQEETPADYIPEATATEKTTASTPAKATGLDRNKLLKKGSKGQEVRELQRLLNIKVDGDFGNKTLTALQAQKGITQTSLNQFDSKPQVATPIATQPKAVAKKMVTPKFGAKLMVASKTAFYTTAKKLANDTWSNTGEKLWSGGNLVYGDYVGEFQKATANGTFLVKRYSDFYFINGNNVKPY